MYFAVLKSVMPSYIHLAANGGISDYEDGKSFIKWFRKFDLFPCLGKDVIGYENASSKRTAFSTCLLIGAYILLVCSINWLFTNSKNLS